MLNLINRKSIKVLVFIGMIMLGGVIGYGASVAVNGFSRINKYRIIIKNNDIAINNLKAEMKQNVSVIGELKETINDLKEDIGLVDSKLDFQDIEKVKITFYAPSEGGINSNGDPSKTAILKKPISGRTCAISTALYEKGWLFHKVYVDGIGIFEATDRMNTKVKGMQVDICTTSSRKARKLTPKHRAIIVKLERLKD